MDLSTHYLGFDLPHPLMPGASPLADDLDGVMRLEDAGAAAIVVRSLFEEQIRAEQVTVFHDIEEHAGAHPEASGYFQDPPEAPLGPERYLEHVAAIRERVGIPVIGSLNGVTPEGWLEYAGLIEQAGADALELNTYFIATDPDETGAEVEERTLGIVRRVKEKLRIPVAVKLSPYFSSLAHLAGRLDALGVDGIVLFNRFYQPDIDVEELSVVPDLRLSNSQELLLRLRWLAILSGRVKCSLAATGGVHDAMDVLKAVMAGADAVQLVSELLAHSPGRLREIKNDLSMWLVQNEYESLEQARGSMNLERTPDRSAYERANYMRVLHSWRT